MTNLMTNIFPITNLSELSSEYMLYKIKGLNRSQGEYYQNWQSIIEKLSYRLQNPVTIIEKEGVPYLVVLNDGKIPPPHLGVLRATVIFERCPGVFKLNYTIRSYENDIICLRFLDFLIQAPLYTNQELWQPGAGQPFFKKIADSLDDSIGQKDMQRFSGFAVRASLTPGGGLGFCVDVTSKTINRKPLPTHLTQEEFSHFKGRHVIYHYGHQWYDIQLTGVSDLNASSYLIPQDRKSMPLLEYAVQECEKPIPPELAQIQHDAAVVLYMNNRQEVRGALAPLCYPLFGTSYGEAGSQHGLTILPPHQRKKLIENFIEQHLQSLRFGNSLIKISSHPAPTQNHMFVMPDFQLGNSTVLSIRGTPGARNVSLEDLGNTRISLLRDPDVGFFNQDLLDRQYLIFPQSVADSYGERFNIDLRQTMKQLFPYEYDPILITYNDRVPKTYPRQGNAILDAVRTKCQMAGYAVVMIHHTDDQVSQEEDQLAAMVVAELRKEFDITAAVIHSTVGQECYQLVQNGGKPEYLPRNDKRSLLSGYLQMVALNKILLTNQRWPFVLGTRLNADLTIGVDVKHNTVGLVSIGSNGSDIRALPPKTSRLKEKLDAKHMKAYFVEIIRLEASSRQDPIVKIVLQRDGRVYDTEIEGIHDAMDLLITQGTLPTNATIAILEIAKTSRTRFRLFDVGEKNGRSWVENPQIGTWCILNENEGYLCTTGRAFRRRGTAKPLYVRKIEGSMSLKECLEDTFYLSALAWTRPNDCSRYPITTRLNDRFLGEEATAYDTDALDIASILEEEDIDE